MELAAPNLIKIFSLTTLSFLLAVLWTPVLSHYLYKYKLTKRLRDKTWDGEPAKLFLKLHGAKKGTPTMGGVLIWITVALVTVAFNWSRSQTWLPVFTLVASGALGFIDDFLNIKGAVCPPK